ncbi:MAG: hypothetical protein II494_02740 [Bacilli bacterium]|nr:hypothetical protein [Bacilli bacterium]
MINNLLPLFVSLEFNESDRRALIVLIIVLIIVLLIIGLIGMGIRWICHKQSEAADNIMYDVTVTHVVMNPQAYRKLANKKSFRLFFRASQIPLLIILVGVLVWIIVAAIRNSWNENIFEDFLDLFFLWHYEDQAYYTKVFGVTVLAEWPAPFEDHPRFILEHLGSYIAVPLILGGSITYLIMAQGYFVRWITIWNRSRSIFTKSLKDFKANTLNADEFKPDPSQINANDANKQ